MSWDFLNKITLFFSLLSSLFISNTQTDQRKCPSLIKTYSSLMAYLVFLLLIKMYRVPNNQKCLWFNGLMDRASAYRVEYLGFEPYQMTLLCAG